jgi:predicted DNA-binding protein
MTTTTIRLPDALKSRLARVADAAGLTPHGFILQAIEAQTSEAEAQAAFHRLASKRLRSVGRSDRGVPWEDARQYLLDRAAGKVVTRPAARKLTR